MDKWVILSPAISESSKNRYWLSSALKACSLLSLLFSLDQNWEWESSGYCREKQSCCCHWQKATCYVSTYTHSVMFTAKSLLLCMHNWTYTCKGAVLTKLHLDIFLAPLLSIHKSFPPLQCGAGWGYKSSLGDYWWRAHFTKLQEPFWHSSQWSALSSSSYEDSAPSHNTYHTKHYTRE